MTSKTKTPASSLAGEPVPALLKPIKDAAKREPVQLYRYQLAQHLVERRPGGWYVAKSWSMVAGEKPMWLGPFDLPQDVCIAIARTLCAELSNRHHVQAAFHKVKPGDPLYGLPTAPKLASRRKRGGQS